MHGRARAPEQVALNVRIPEHPERVGKLEHAHEVVEARVQAPEIVRPKGVGLGPVRPAGVPPEDSLEPLEELAIRDDEPVRSARRGVLG